MSRAELHAVFGEEMTVHVETSDVMVVDLQISLDQPQLFLNMLGGTVKIAEVIKEVGRDSRADWAGIVARAVVSEESEKGKTLYGVGLYSFSESHESVLKKLLKDSKGILKIDGVSARFVNKPWKTVNNVAVLKEDLVENGVDVVIVETKEGYIFGKTVAIQDFEAYSERDFNKPRRNPKRGMLPPKLAQIMINLAGVNCWPDTMGIKSYEQGVDEKVVAELESEDLAMINYGDGEAKPYEMQDDFVDEDLEEEIFDDFLTTDFDDDLLGDDEFSDDDDLATEDWEDEEEDDLMVSDFMPGDLMEGIERWSRGIIFDPFCGNGTVLMEAMLMGFDVIGSDLSEDAVEDTKKNLQWLKRRFPHTKERRFYVFQKDVQELDELDLMDACMNVDPEDLDSTIEAMVARLKAVVTETYLGPPMKQFPSEEVRKKVEDELSGLMEGTMTKLKEIFGDKVPAVVTLPIYRLKKQYFPMEKSVEKIKSVGYSSSALLKDRASLVYDRPDQVVGREVWKFTLASEEGEAE